MASKSDSLLTSKPALESWDVSNGIVSFRPTIPARGAKLSVIEPGEILGGALQFGGCLLFLAAFAQPFDQRHLGVAAQLTAVECMPPGRFGGGVIEPRHDLHGRHPDRRALGRGEGEQFPRGVLGRAFRQPGSEVRREVFLGPEHAQQHHVVRGHLARWR